MPKLYLHAGTHKTGTSAIQKFATWHRVQLLDRGILYPNYEPFRKKIPEAHHDFAHALAETSQSKLSLEQVSNLPQRWLEEAVRQDAKVFVSVEALYRHVLGDGARMERRRQYVERLAEVLDDFDVTVVLVFRRPDNYIRSLYQERVMRSVRSMPHFARFRELSKEGGLQYHKNATLFASLFSSVTCLIYEDLMASGKFISEFFNTVGVDVGDLDDMGVVRKSLNVPESCVKNLANAHLRDRKESERFLEWLRTPQTASVINEAFGGKEYDLWTSHDEREQFLEGRAGDVEKLREEFFPTRTSLFPPLHREETRPPLPELPEDLRRLILGYFGESAK